MPNKIKTALLALGALVISLSFSVPALAATPTIDTNNPIIKDVQQLVDFLSGLVAIVVVGTIIVGGIQYSMAGNSPEAVAKARQRIANGLIALAVFLLLFAFLQWLIPGGIFS